MGRHGLGNCAVGCLFVIYFSMNHRPIKTLAEPVAPGVSFVFFVVIDFQFSTTKEARKTESDVSDGSD